MAYVFVLLAMAFGNISKRKYQNEAAAITLIAMALVGGLRFQTGYDWNAYEESFNEIDINSDLLKVLSESTFEPLYTFASYIAKVLGGTIQSIFLTSSIFFSASLYFLLTNTRTNPNPTIALYIGFCYLMAYFIVVRFAIAAAFLYIGYYYLSKGNWRAFTALVAIASGFHVFAIIALPLIFLSTKRPSQFYTVLIIITIACISRFFDFTEILSLLALIESDGFISKFTAYTEGNSEAIPLTVIIFALANSVILLIISRTEASTKQELSLLSMAYWLTFCLLMAIAFTFQIPSIWNRVMLLAIPIQGIALGISAAKLGRRASAGYRAISSGLAVGMFAYAIYPEDTFFLPYESYIEELLGFSTGIGRQRMNAAF